MRIHSKLPLLTALVIAAFTLSFMGVQAQENSLATVADSLNGKIELFRKQHNLNTCFTHVLTKLFVHLKSNPIAIFSC